MESGVQATSPCAWGAAKMSTGSPGAGVGGVACTLSSRMNPHFIRNTAFQTLMLLSAKLEFLVIFSPVCLLDRQLLQGTRCDFPSVFVSSPLGIRAVGVPVSVLRIPEFLLLMFTRCLEIGSTMVNGQLLVWPEACGNHPIPGTLFPTDLP